MKLPDFIIIGAAKAGTTSLYALLDRHPDIFMPIPKEPEFFARDDHYAKGIDSYAPLFEGATPHQQVGEASTLYSLAPLFGQTAERIKAHLPQVKLIYVMREPVARAYSFYVQLIKNYQNVTGDLVVHRSFEEFIDPEEHKTAAPRDKVLSPANDHMPDVPDLCLAGSDYLHQIDAYLKHFPPEQILFLSFEQFVADSSSAVRRITEFLELAPLPEAVFEQKSVTRNVSKDHFDALGTDIAVQNMRRRAGALWTLRKVVPASLRHRLKGAVFGSRQKQSRAHIPAPMLDQTRTSLRARFGGQRAALETLTGLDLSAWQ